MIGLLNEGLDEKLDSKIICNSNSNEDKKDSLFKLFGDISSISDKELTKNFHYMCNKCFKFIKIIIDKDKIKFICDDEKCKNFNQPIIIEDVYEKMIELKDNNFDILECDEHKGEKFVYYCNECKDNKCGQCGKFCEEKKHHLKDLNRDMITKKKRDYIKSKCDERNEYFKEKINKQNKNFENNFINDAFNEENYKITYQDANTCEITKVNYVINDLNKKKEKELLNIIDIIISDYDNFPNYRHIENISFLEKYMNYNYGKKLNVFTLEYKLTDEDKIQLFGDIFIENNKDNCFLVINNKYFDLNKYIYYKDIFEDKNNDIIKVELLEKENKIINDMSYMFNGVSALLPTSDFSKFDSSNVINVSYMFYKCEHLTFLPDISKLKTTNVINMTYMFNNCFSLESLPEGISDWETSNVNNMSHMFSNCKSLKSLPDISKWKTFQVIDITSIFSNCSAIKKMPDISKWNTNNIRYMNSIFYNCNSLESLPDIKKWNFDKVINMVDILEGSPYNLPLLTKTNKRWEKIKNWIYDILIIIKEFILSANINYLPLFIAMIILAIIFIYFCFRSIIIQPFYLIYLGLRNDAEEFHFNYQNLYDFFTEINGGKEYNSEKNQIFILNITFVVIIIIKYLYFIFEKKYDKLKSKYFLIIFLILNWSSIIIIIKNIYTFSKLSNSFVIYRKNVNKNIYYKHNNSYINYTNNYTDIDSYNDTYNNTSDDENNTDFTDDDNYYKTNIISYEEYGK